MLNRIDEKFVSECFDPSKREKALRREKRNQWLCLIAAALAAAAWVIHQRHWLAGTGPSSAFADFVFLCIVIGTTGLSLFTRSNIRLLLGLRALEERVSSATARAGDS
jgi:hypothetical protein